jgi:putative flavoprotein involved in K+ transport
VDGSKIKLAPDLREKLTKADRFEAHQLRAIDKYIARNHLDAPPEKLPTLRDGYAADKISELDLASAGISTVIWASGYRFDYGLVHLPVLDDDGYPIQKRGATRYPGLYFAGLPWLHRANSGNLSGVGDDASFIASSIAARAVDQLSTQIRLPAMAGSPVKIPVPLEQGADRGLVWRVGATRATLVRWSRRTLSFLSSGRE